MLFKVVLVAMDIRILISNVEIEYSDCNENVKAYLVYFNKKLCSSSCCVLKKKKIMKPLKISILDKQNSMNQFLFVLFSNLINPKKW